MWNVWHSQRLIFCNSDSRPKRTASNNVKTLLFTLLLSLIYIFAMYYWQYQSHRIITQYTNVWYPCRLLSATCLVLRKELDIRRCSLSTYIALNARSLTFRCRAACVWVINVARDMLGVDLLGFVVNIRRWWPVLGATFRWCLSAGQLEKNIERPEPPTVQFLVVDTSVCQFQQMSLKCTRWTDEQQSLSKILKSNSCLC